MIRINSKCGAMFQLAALACGVVSVMPANAQNQRLQLEEIVVTAQRRAENLQEVPIAVTAVTSEDLANRQVDSIANIQQISPSIKFDVTNSAANSANILIRGIGTVGNSRAFEGAVGVFVDGVYRTRAGQAMQNWLDIDGLQVLRGPQGTLFGKNTSAGALILNSSMPTLEERTLNLELSLGNYNKKMMRAAVNLPLSETLAVRVAGLWGEQDGYIENPNGGEYNERSPMALKVQALYQPSDIFNAHLIVDYSDESNNCCYGQMDAVDGPTQPIINSLIAARGLALPSANIRDYEQVLSGNTDQTIRDKGAVLKMNWELDSGATLSSVTALRDWSISQVGMDADFTGANILFINEYLSTEMFSQEFTLSGNVGGFGPFDDANYVVGVYYGDEEIDAGSQLLWGDQAQSYWNAITATTGLFQASEGLWAESRLPATSKTYAAFTHWNFNFSESLGVTVGLRYSRDKKSGAMISHYFDPDPFAAFRLISSQPGSEYDESFTDSAVSGSLAMKYHFSDSVMGYVSYSRGYKSGGVNIDNNGAGDVTNNPNITPGAQPEDPRYKSEFVDGYELGLKAEYLNGLARSNVAIFYNDITDLQIAQFLGTRFKIDNAPKAEVYGIEVENEFLISEVFSLNLDITHLADASFDDNSNVIGTLAGRRFAHAPEFAANLSLSMNQPLDNGLSLFGRISTSYSGGVYTNTSNDHKRESESEYALSIGIRSDSEVSWSVTAWCQNCSDERYISQHFNSPLQAGDANAYVVAPRTYGLTLRSSF